MDRAALVKARVSETRQIALAAKDAAPPCRLCASAFGDRCGNVAFSELTFEPSTGSSTEAYRTKQREARASTGLCGPEGLLFEHKSPAQMVTLRAKERTIQGLTWAAGAVVVAGLLADFMGY